MTKAIRAMGITGGIGSGKSTFASLLAAASGGLHLDGDQLSREVTAPGSRGLEAVITRFGEELLTPSKALDRRRLGALVFADPAALSDLEAILHPLIGDRLLKTLDTGPFPVIYEATLLFEAGHDRHMDLTIAVVAPARDIIARVAARDGHPEGHIRDRLKAQHDDAYRTSRADMVVVNDGAPGDLSGKAATLWRDLVRGTHLDRY